MCLGIYEDTGSFTFSSTTEKDFLAAAFLLSKGANLNVVSDLIARELSPEQVSLLNDMIQAATRVPINRVDIVITHVTAEKYMPDFAFLVQKMVKMENINAIFALARMEDKIYVVARSRTDEVDVGAVVSALGGGGHPYAAAATIKGETLAQTENRLLEILYATIRSRRRAQDLMSSPAIIVRENVSCENAKDLLTRYNINALLVVKADDTRQELSGFITRQVIEKVLYHKLGHVPVHDYMTTDLASVTLDADIHEIQEKIIENKQRILPVLDNARIAGVITRTDLLNFLVHQSQSESESAPDPTKELVAARTRNIAKFMRERLSARLMRTLQKIGEVAGQLGCRAYVVGGFVRDLFLYRHDEDLDIVIEGEGIAFAKQFAKLMGARTHSHEKFGTAVIIFSDGLKIDVASARLEYYTFPAALPVVEMSSIKLDLYRRDFTINTLAIQLNPDKFGTLIDFFSARRDIKEKVIRVLHNLSFVEDPTRVFRAIRFEQRFGFTIGKLTAGLIENAVSMDFFRGLSGRRVFSELRQILEEENPVPAIVRLQDFELLKVISPAITFDEDLIDRLNSVKKVLSWHDLLFLDETYMKWVVYFLALIHPVDPKSSEEICRRFELAPRHRKVFSQDRFEAMRCSYWLEQNLPTSNSRLYQQLSGFKNELILYMMAVAKLRPIKKAISHYFTHLRHIQITIKGEDLKRMGLPPGPAYRRILQAILDAKLNGQLKTHEDELEYAADLAQQAMAVQSAG